MDSDEEASLAEMRKVVEDAGLYETNMTYAEIVGTCKMLNESRNMAHQQSLEHEDNLKNTTDSPVSHPSNQNPPTQTAVESDNENDDNTDSHTIEKPIKDATKTVFGYNDMLDCDCHIKELTILHRVPKYRTVFDIPCFINGTETQRYQLLDKYHRYLWHVGYQKAKNQFLKAPMPDPIKLTMANAPSDESEESTYVCRSGRQTKKRNYSDEAEEIEDDSKPKKSKAAEKPEWLSKNQLAQTTATKTYKFKKANITVQKEAKELVENEVSAATASPAVAPGQVTITPKPLTIAEAKKLANTTIIKRSKLFKDIPTRSPRNTSRRCESMFDILKGSEKQKEKSEKEMERFEESLTVSTQEVNMDAAKAEEMEEVSPDIIICEDLPKRRVVPPIPGRRPPIHSKKTTKQSAITPGPSTSQKATEQTSSKPPENEIKSLRKRPFQDQSRFDDILVESSRVKCPICLVEFPETEIQAHAATCGDDLVITRVSTKYQQITCEICDKTFPMNNEYEAHTRDCQKRKEEQDRRYQAKRLNI